MHASLVMTVFLAFFALLTCNPVAALTAQEKRIAQQSIASEGQRLALEMNNFLWPAYQSAYQSRLKLQNLLCATTPEPEDCALRASMEYHGAEWTKEYAFSEYLAALRCHPQDANFVFCKQTSLEQQPNAKNPFEPLNYWEGLPKRFWMALDLSLPDDEHVPAHIRDESAEDWYPWKMNALKRDTGSQFYAERAAFLHWIERECAWFNAFYRHEVQEQAPETACLALLHEMPWTAETLEALTPNEFPPPDSFVFQDIGGGL